MVEFVKDKEHLNKVLEENKLVLLDFSAEWCGPCKSFEPIFAEYAVENSATIKCLKINIDENQDIALQYNVRSIPALMLIKDGNVIDHKVGSLDKQTLENWIESKT